MPSITSPARRATCRPSWVAPRCWVSIPSCCDGSAQARQVVGELDQLRIVDRLQRFEHYRLVSAPRTALVFAQCFQEVVLALTGDAGHGLLSGRIGAVAHIAMVLLGQRAGQLEA